MNASRKSGSAIVNLKLKVLGFHLALPLLAAAAPGTPAAPPLAEPAPPPRSVFIDRPDFGRDPFFPNSKRRGEVVRTPVLEPTNFKDLALKGISNNPPLAIINNKTFAVGEEDEVRVNGVLVKVKLTEIREKSAVITVNGVSKELFLGQKF